MFQFQENVFASNIDQLFEAMSNVSFADKLFMVFTKGGVVDKVKLSNGKHTVFYDETFAANVTDGVVLHSKLIAEILALGRKEPPRKDVVKALKQLRWNPGDKPDFDLETFALRSMFSDVGRHSRNVKDGTRTPNQLLRLIELYKQCLPDRSPSPRDPSPSKRAFSHPRERKEEVNEDVGKTTIPVRDKIFAKYNLKTAGATAAFEDNVLVLDSDGEEDVFVGNPPEPEIPAPQTFSYKEYTDYACQRLMRLHSNGNLEPGEMFVSGSSAFMQCRFRNGDVRATEFPIVSAAPKGKPPVRKRPAANVLVAPVKVCRQAEPADEGEGEEEEEEVEDAVEEEEDLETPSPLVSRTWAPGALVTSTMPDGKIKSWSFSNGSMQGSLTMCYAKDQSYLHGQPRGGKKIFFGGLSCGYKDHAKIMQDSVGELLCLSEDHYANIVDLKKSFLIIRDKLKQGAWIEE